MYAPVLIVVDVITVVVLTYVGATLNVAESLQPENRAATIYILVIDNFPANKGKVLGNVRMTACQELPSVEPAGFN